MGLEVFNEISNKLVKRIDDIFQAAVGLIFTDVYIHIQC